MVNTDWAETRHLSAEALGKFIPVPFHVAFRERALSAARARFLRLSAIHLGLRGRRS